MKFFVILPVLLARLCSSAALIPRNDALTPVDEAEDSASLTSPWNPSPASAQLDSRDDAADLAPALIDSAPTAGTELIADPHPEKGLGLFLGAIRNRLVYFAAAKISHILVKAVIAQLEKHKIIGKPDKATLDFIESALTKITIIILMMALVASNPPTGSQIVNVGLNDGHGKVKRDTFLLDHPDHPMDAVTWDLADDEAHFSGNNFSSRAIISDDLRADMLAQGHRNVTFLHTSHPETDTKSPFLVYHTPDNGQSHYHWRPPTETEAQSDLRKRNQNFEKHYPFFDANGAGFKISAQNPIDKRGSPATHDDAAAMAALMVKDFLKKRTGTTAAGYEEEYKTSKFVGHKLCYIAEMTRFSLHPEVDLCFVQGKEPGK
ncbi:hypothetical protein K461DRAFT_174120 [Myriangium duriaei CBS 260.36]|uniref:Uncharacterized protein n=1 Tax=Myriangium duriaei CBS 260.36 TaxID=1168546 RepID=A0A9P4IX18_9PEZI|nr:hypothetical protein K461DRAFT_174120 [Myriangium duriaei CBS 260.36]